MNVTGMVTKVVCYVRCFDQEVGNAQRMVLVKFERSGIYQGLLFSEKR